MLEKILLIVIGMVIAFIIIHICCWFIQKAKRSTNIEITRSADGSFSVKAKKVNNGKR